MPHYLLTKRRRRILLLDPSWDAAKTYLEMQPQFQLIDSNQNPSGEWSHIADLIIAEIDTPGAWEKAQNLISSLYAKGVPIILVGEHFQTENDQKAAEMGAEDYWVKSNDPIQIGHKFTQYFRRISRKLQDLQSFMNGLFKSLPNTAVVWFDSSLNVLLAGGEILYRLGLAPDDLTGKPLDLSQFGEKFTAHQLACKSAIEGKGSLFEVVVQELELLVHLLPQALSNAELSGLMLIQDVSPQRAAGEQRILGSLGDSTSLMVAYIDQRKKYLYVNRSYCDWINRPMSDVLNKKVDDILPKFLAEQTLPWIEKALIGKKVQFDIDYNHPKLGRRHCLTTYVPQISQGVPQGFLAVLQDLSEFYENQEKAVFFKEMIDKSADAFAILAADTGRIVDFNEQMLSIFGYTDEELRQLSVVDIDDNLKGLSQWQTISQHTKARGRALIETVGCRKDGSKFEAEVSSHFIENHGAEFFVVVIRDVTARKKLQYESLAKRIEVSTIFKAFGDIYLWLDPKGVVCGYQLGDFEELGIGAHKLIGHSFAQAFSGEPWDKVEKGLAQIAEGSAQVSINFALPTARGPQVFAVRMIPVLANQILLILRNQSPLVEAKAQLKQLTNQVAVLENQSGLHSGVIDLDKDCCRWSEGAGRLLGLDPKKDSTLEDFLSLFDTSARNQLIEQLSSQTEEDLTFSLKLPYTPKKQNLSQVTIQGHHLKGTVVLVLKEDLKI